MISEITFQHFFVETASKIEPYMYKMLNPYTMKFFKADTVYFAAVTVGDKEIEVTCTVGTGITGFREFVKSCKAVGIEILRFGCSEHNKTVQTIYRYAGAVKTGETKNYYSNGDSSYGYELNIKESKRLKNL